MKRTSQSVILVTVLLAMLLMIPGAVGAQQQPSSAMSEKILVDKSALPPELVKSLEVQAKLDEEKAKIETYGKYVGLGKEVGMAMNEGLSALTDNAEKFASTKPGQFTMFIIAYKVLGKDLIQAVFGIIFFLVGTAIFIWMWRRNGIVRRIAVETPKDAPKKYELYEPDSNVQMTYVICYLIFFAIDVLVIFV